MKLWPKYVDCKVHWDVWIPVLIGIATYLVLYSMGIRYGFE